METVIGEEGGLAGGRVDGVVVRKFSDWQPSCPIIMLRGHVST